MNPIVTMKIKDRGTVKIAKKAIALKEWLFFILISKEILQ